MNLEEAKEKESCDKSASEESRAEMTNNLWQSFTMASKPKFQDDSNQQRRSLNHQFVSSASLFTPTHNIADDG